MTQYIRRLGAPIAIVALTLFSACSSDAKGKDSLALGADSALNRDLALAGADSTAQPQLNDAPATPEATPRPVASKPKPRPAAPKPAAPKPSAPVTTTTASGNTVTKNANPSNAGGGAVGTISEGTTLNTVAASKICTNTNQVGDHVSATLENSVSGSNGAVIPAGATVNLTVTALKRSENANDAIVMEFAVNSVTFGGRTYPIEGSVTSASVERVRDQPKSKDIQKVGIGAVAGAIAGKVLGGSTKATVIGGAAGAAAGAAAAAATANYQGCINSGGSIVVKLTAPAQVRAS